MATKVAKQVEITLPRAAKKILTVTIRGITSLMVNRFPDETLQKMVAEQSGKAQKPGRKDKKVRDPNAEFNQARYINSKGKDCFPCASIKNALVRSGMQYTKDKSPLLKTSIIIPADTVEIKGSKPRMDTRIVRVGMGRDPMPRFRPIYDEWEMTFPLKFNPEVFSAEQVLNLVALTGEYIGIGEFNPLHGGDLGLFEITEVRSGK